MTPRPRLITSVLLLPVALHTVAMGITILRSGQRGVIFNAFDFAVLAVLVAYLMVCAYAASRPAAGARLALATYSLLLALALGEFLISPRVNLPLVPGRIVLEPGANLIGCRSPVHWTVNARGVRGPDAAPASFSNAILCVGGSTTECLYVTDEESWPWRLGTELGRLTGQAVYSGNVGRAGHDASQHAYLLEHYTHVKDFNVVVLLVGVNDLHRFLCIESYLPIEHREVFPIARVDYGDLLSGRKLYYKNLEIFNLVRVAMQGPPSDGRGFVQDLKAEYHAGLRAGRLRLVAARPFDDLPDLGRLLGEYRGHLGRAIAQCRENGQKVVVMTQPTLYREDLPPELEALIWVTFREGRDGAYTTRALAEGIGLVNAATMEVCREEGVPCLDLAAVVPKDTSAFYDHCHLNNGGCRIVAEALARFLVESGVLRGEAAANGG